MIINENILETLLAFSNLKKKKIVKNFTEKRQLPKLPLLNFLAKFLIEKISLKNNFIFVRLKFFR